MGNTLKSPSECKIQSPQHFGKLRLAPGIVAQAHNIPVSTYAFALGELVAIRVSENSNNYYHAIYMYPRAADLKHDDVRIAVYDPHHEKNCATLPDYRATHPEHTVSLNRTYKIVSKFTNKKKTWEANATVFDFLGYRTGVLHHVDNQGVWYVQFYDYATGTLSNKLEAYNDAHMARVEVSYVQFWHLFRNESAAARTAAAAAAPISP